MTVRIEYFSDVLCIWAWIAQRRLDELNAHFGEQIEISSRYVNVFGNTQTQIGEKWESRGGFEAFGKHVIDAAALFPDAPVHPELWTTTRPLSSTPSHTFLKAVELAHSPTAAAAFATLLRKRFFTEAIDIGQMEILLELTSDAGLDRTIIIDTLNSGAAIAAVMQDYQAAQSRGIRGSPSWVLDDGRQILYGNVGFRVLRANAAELLEQASGEASWC